jgi:antistasin family protein
MSYTEPKAVAFGLACLAVVLGASCSGHGGVGRSDGGDASAGNGGAGGAAAHAGSAGMAGGTVDAGKSPDSDGSGGASGAGGAAGSDAGGAAGASGNGDSGAAGHTVDAGVCIATACDATCELGFKNDDKGCPTCQCNATRVSCATDQCGPPPAGPQVMCLDGSTIVPTCAQAAGGCKWGFAPCPPVVCPTLTCAQACPNGSHVDEKGCVTCSCILSNECAVYGSYDLCHTHAACAWLSPGCDPVALAKASCFPKTDLGCQQDMDCTGQRHCIFRSVSTCPPSSDGGVGCFACIEQRICF